MTPGRVALVAAVLIISVVAVVVYLSKSKPDDERVFTEEDGLGTSFVLTREIRASSTDTVTWAAEGMVNGSDVQIFLFEGAADAGYISRQTLRLTNFKRTATIGNVGLLCEAQPSCDLVRDELDTLDREIENR